MCSRNIKKHLPVAEVGGGWSRRSVEVGSRGRWRSVAEVGGRRRRSVAEVGSGGGRCKKGLYVLS